VIPAPVHETFGVVDRPYAPQLNNFSAGAIRTVGYSEVHERRIVDKDEAICHDESVKPITCIGAGINASSRGPEAKEGEGDDKGGPVHEAHSRNPKPVLPSIISMPQISSTTSRALGSPKSMSFQILLARTGLVPESRMDSKKRLRTVAASTLVPFLLMKRTSVITN
jgi:hypothetical protein